MSTGNSDGIVDWKTRNCEMDFSDPNIKHDRIIVVEGQKFHVMADILSFSSEYFQELLNKYSGYKEAYENEIEINEVKADDFKEFLKAIYPPDFAVTVDNYRPLIALANRFLSGIVLQKCKKFMVSEFDKNALEILEVAFDMDEVKDKFVKFLRKETTVPCHKCAQFTCSDCKRDYLFQEHTVICYKYDSYLKRNHQRIQKLPMEIQCFILDILIKPDKRRV